MLQSRESPEEAKINPAGTLLPKSNHEIGSIAVNTAKAAFV